MKDLELMHLLEDLGCEPSIDNLIILKEALENGEANMLTEARKSVEERSKLNVNSEEWEDTSPEMKSRVFAMEFGHDGDRERRGYAHKVEALRKEKSLPKDTGNHHPETPRHTAATHVRAERQIERSIKKQADYNKRMKEPNTVSESFSDYELYQILDSNGYTTTEKNLSILKEGLDSGRFIIESND